MSHFHHILQECLSYNVRNISEGNAGEIFMKILYEDKSIIVCIKPVGTASQEGTENSLPDILKKESGLNEIYTVHRLDTVTSGVMVYAKTKSAASDLTRQITENCFKKEYIAAVHGTLEEKEGTMEDFLFKDSRKNKSFVVKRERKGVKKAKLEYRVIQENNGFSLVKIKLHTGRTHQIRVQFSSRRHPVYGDGKYGASDNVPYIALFSHSLTFRHPVSKEPMTFSEPAPQWEFMK